jgi:hypothetical protein
MLRVGVLGFWCSPLEGCIIDAIRASRMGWRIDEYYLSMISDILRFECVLKPDSLDIQYIVEAQIVLY